MTSISCASSVHSVLAQKSPLSQCENRSKSCDTVCSSSSSCFFKRRKPMNPLAYSLRPTHHKVNPNSVKQRVMSAKMLKLRQLQSQLNDANFHLAEVARENQTLKTLQKRQDKALSKYEHTNADLPRLLHSHEEEIKVLTDKNKTLRKNVRELTEQVKQKEEELIKIREQLTHLDKLNKDKHLTEREKLMEQMEELKDNFQRSEEQVITLNRKLGLESKISKQRLNAELVKHKQCQKELLHAFDEIDRLTGLLEAKENQIRPRHPKFNKLQNRDSMSMITLKHYQSPNWTSSGDRQDTQKNGLNVPVTEVKLEPLVNGTKMGNTSKKSNGFKAPMDNIRQRLSSGSTNIRHDLNSLSCNHGSEVSTESRENSAESLPSRPGSSLRLEKLPSVQENQRMQGGKINWEKENKFNKDGKEKVEENVSDYEKLRFDRNELEEIEKEIDVMYENEKDGIRLQASDSDDIIKNPINSTNERKGVTFNDQSDNDSDVDLVNMIQRMKKEKQDETKMLGKTANNKRKNSGEFLKGQNLNIRQSEEEFERITESLDAAIQRATENSKEEYDQKLGSYCSEVLSSVKNCSKVIKVHKDSLESSIQDTNTLMETLKRTEKVESKLKKSFFNMDDDMDFVNEILSEEYKFQAENKNTKQSTHDKKSLVNLDNKKKLLATLRAIDNGDSVDSIEEKQGNFVNNERFGHVAH